MYSFSYIFKDFIKKKKIITFYVGTTQNNNNDKITFKFLFRCINFYIFLIIFTTFSKNKRLTIHVKTTQKQE